MDKFTSVIYFSISEKKVIEGKKNKNNKEKIFKELRVKFHLFFILSFLFLIIFWYYLSCFCAVYKNKQIHLLKDTLIFIYLFNILNK